MPRAVFLGIVLLLAGCKGASPASEPAPQAPSPRFASLEAVVSQLKAEKPPSPLARRLGITTCGIQRYGRPFACADEEITVLYPRLDEATETGILRIEEPHPDGDGSVDLVVFAREKDRSWSLLDAVRFFHPYSPVEIEFRSLVKPPAQEILIHGICLGNGTGVYFGDFAVLKLVSGRLRSVFAAGEVGKLTANAFADPNSLYEASSTFRFGLGAITETAEYRVGNQRYEIVRGYQWSDAFRAFLPNYDDKIRLLATQAPHKK
jgi:hypothetical protein